MTNQNHTPPPPPDGDPTVPDTEAAEAGEPGGWSAVVYGRTLQVDQWWRALPAGADRQGPLGDAVRAVVAGGNRLEHGPRFLLHRDGHGVLVGAACELGLISRTMVNDRFGRPLYGFVGWYRAAPTGGRIPGLAELADRLADWAGPVYRQWTEQTWTAVGRDEAEPRATRPAAVPWAEPLRAGTAGPAAAPVWLPTRSDGAHLLPETAADELWSAAAAGTDRCVLVTGWRRRSDAEPAELTHLTSADCRGYEFLRRPLPPQPTASPGQAGRAGKAGQAGRPAPSGSAKPAPGANPRTADGAGAEGQRPPAADAEPSLRDTLREVGARTFGKVARALFASDEPARPEPGRQEPGRQGSGRREPGPQGSGRPEPGPGDPGTRGCGAGEPRPEAPGTGERGRKERGRESRPGGASPVTGWHPYGDLGGPPPTPVRPGQGATPPPGAGRVPPAPRPERPVFDRTRSVDPKEADFSGMFGGFDDPEPEPDPAPTPPSAPPATPPTPPAGLPIAPPATPPFTETTPPAATAPPAAAPDPSKSPPTDPGTPTDPVPGEPS
ncbi:hypothetical protein [Kitasatospora sp. NPDC093806]|uniref:hypothetical protein n=1 Tax=Kitasatospora sp. NPDC093806 TaxID=3155075 RepID=UPI003425141D